MPSCEKLIRDEQHTDRPILNEDEKSTKIITCYLINGCKSKRILRKNQTRQKQQQI